MRTGKREDVAGNGRVKPISWLAVAMAPVVFRAASSARAASDTWTGGGGDANWMTPANWGGAAPGNGDNLIFAGATNLLTANNFVAGTLFGSINFSTTAGTFTLANNGITLGGNITDGSTALQTISLPIQLSGNGSFAVATSGNLAIGGTISQSGGPQGITQGVGQTSTGQILTGAGATTLSGANTFAGATTIAAGFLKLDYNVAAGGTTILNPASTLTTGGRGTFQVNGNAGNTTVQAVNGLSVHANTNSSIVATTSGAATTLNLGAIAGAAAGSVDFQNFPDTTTTTTTPNGAGGIMGAYYTAGTGNGAGESWAVSAASGGSPGAITPLTTFDTIFTSNTNEDVSATSSAPAGPLTFNSLRVSGAGALTLTLSGANTISTGGILNTRVQSGNGPVISGTGSTLTSSSGELVINNRVQDNFSVNSQLIGNMNLTIINQQTPATSIDPNDNNNDNDDGSVIFGAAAAAPANTFTGTITVASGRLQITTNVGGLGNAANPVFVVGGLQGGGQIQDNNLNLDPTGTHTITISGLGTAEDDGGSFGAVRVRNKLSSPIVLAGTSRIGVGVNAGGTYAGPISGNFELWLDSDLATHQLILSNANNSWSGGTRIERGVIQMGIANALPQSTIVTFGSLIPASEFYSPEGKSGNALNATLNLAGFATTIGGAQVFSGDTALTGEFITNSVVATPATLTVNSAVSTTFGGIITNASGATLGLTKTGNASFTLSGANNYVGDTNINGGTLTLDFTGALATPNVNVAANAVANLNGIFNGANPTNVTANGNVNVGVNNGINGPAGSILVRNWGTLNVGAGGSVNLAATSTANHGQRNVLVLNSSSANPLTNAGRIDLSNNDMIVQHGSTDSVSTAGSIANQLKLGFNAHAGYWNGAAGIVSTSAAADTRFLTTLGYRVSDGTLFDGVTPSAGSDVLVKYTYYGDADLNGTVNGSDYQQIDLGFGGHMTGWSNGDFNYDGVVDGSDYALIDNTFNQLAATPALTNPLALAASPAASSAVPEPTALGILAISALGMLRRRKRRSMRMAR